MKKVIALIMMLVTVTYTLSLAGPNPGREICVARPNTGPFNRCTYDPNTGSCTGGCVRQIFITCRDCNEGSTTCAAPVAGSCTSTTDTTGCFNGGNGSLPSCKCDPTGWVAGRIMPGAQGC